MIQVNKIALLCLQWALGVILFIQAALLALSSPEFPLTQHPALLHSIHLMIAVAEMLACILLLVPQTARLGAKLLIGVIIVAALVHILHGSYQIGSLVIFAAAAWVVLSQKGNVPGAPA